MYPPPECSRADDLSRSTAERPKARHYCLSGLKELFVRASPCLFKISKGSRELSEFAIFSINQGTYVQKNDLCDLKYFQQRRIRFQNQDKLTRVSLSMAQPHGLATYFLGLKPGRIVPWYGE